MKIDKKLIKELTDYLNEFKLTEIEYGNNELKIKVSKANTLQPVISTTVENKKEKSNQDSKIETSGKKITSPIIGTAYLSPEPGAKKFSEVGQKIKKGQTIMIVEAMKTMNHVPSTQDGVVIKILVKDGEPVEFGQPLISIK